MKTLTISAYGYLQSTMREEGLLNDNGSPKKSNKMPLNSQEMLSVYAFFGDKVRGIDKPELDKYSVLSNEALQKLLNIGQKINQILFALFIARYVIDNSDKMTQNMIGNKVNRLIDYASKEIREHHSQELITTTSRAADNLCRQLSGRCKLSDELRVVKNKFMSG